MSLLRYAGRFGAVAVLVLSTLATAAAPSASSSSSAETTSSRSARCAEGVDAAREDTRSNASYDTNARASTPGSEEETNSWGPFCEARLCMSDAECACGWRGGYCDENSVCQYN